MSRQKTIAKPISLEGKTLWKDGDTRLRINPAESGTGIILIRSDTGIEKQVSLSLNKVRVYQRRVVLKGNGVRISFIEHLLAGLWGMGIDNARVEIDGAELPFFDGSALPYVKAIKKAGVVEQKARRRILKLRGSMTYISRGRMIHIRPSARLGISYLFRGTRLRFRRFHDIEAVFADNIAPARTFAVGSYPEHDYPFTIRTQGRFSFPYPARYADELLRHKVLDMIGDIALLGIRPAVHIWAAGTGHRETHEAIKLLTKERK